MGQLVFQATLGGQVNLVGPNTASTFNINVPAVAGNMVTTGDTGTVTSTMLATAVYTAPGTIGSGTPNTGAFTTLSGSTSVTTPIVKSATSLTLQTNGTTSAVTIDTSQNVGVGVTPKTSGISGYFELGADKYISSQGDGNTFASNAYFSSGWKYAATAAASRYTQYSGQHQWFTSASGSANAAITFTQAMTLDASGNLGIGTTSPATNLHIQASTQPTIQFTDVGTGAGRISMTNAMIFGVDGSDGSTERARIDSSGNLLVGATSNSPSTVTGTYIYGGATTAGYLLNNGTTGAGISLALFYSSYSTANETKFEVTSEGNVKSRTNSYAGFSDARLKQGITPASTQWNDIKNIEVVKFQMKSEQFSDAENPWMLGVIAQQVEQVSPGLVDEDVKDGMKTVKYSILYMKAVKALQEAMARIEQLETRITALEGA